MRGYPPWVKYHWPSDPDWPRAFRCKRCGQVYYPDAATTDIALYRCGLAFAREHRRCRKPIEREGK